MEIVFTEEFNQTYDKLDKTEKRRVQKAVDLLASNPRHPSLQVKKMQGWDVWEARASGSLRMTFDMIGDTITLRKVGQHDTIMKNP